MKIVTEIDLSVVQLNYSYFSVILNCKSIKIMYGCSATFKLNIIP